MVCSDIEKSSKRYSFLYKVDFVPLFVMSVRVRLSPSIATTAMVVKACSRREAGCISSLSSFFSLFLSFSTMGGNDRRPISRMVSSFANSCHEVYSSIASGVC